MKLNLGSGPLVVSGWISVDRSPTIALGQVPLVTGILRRAGLLTDAHLTRWPPEILRHDIRRRLPFADASVDAIYSSHALEHVHLDEARRVLAECHRLLRPAGVLRLALPDALALAESLTAGERDGVAGAGLTFNRHLYAYPETRPGLRTTLLRAVGSSIHRWQPTEGLVRELLVEAGFPAVERRDFRDGKLPDLDLVEHRERSLFVEAVK